MSTQWVPAPGKSDVAGRLAQELGIPIPIAHILACRGLETAVDAHAFLYPALDQLHSPSLMSGMCFAVYRLRQAIEKKEPILIYGDYDVDGTIATVLLKTAIERSAVSLETTADVRYHIPHRIREGYGIQESRIAEAATEGIRLVISVDTGIRAFAAAEEAKRLGLDLIVTDHHLPDTGEGVPDAIAVLNPNQPGCTYPYKELCGAGVAFKLAQALLEDTARNSEERSRLKEKLLPSFLKLLAIATIADAVPLTGENRVIASLGLVELRKPAQPGLKTLMELAQIDTSRPISSTDIGFRLAPRINAAGRMDIASDVVDMFLAKDPALARELAEKLHRLNEDRRATEAEALQAIESLLETMASTPEGLANCLVLDDAPAVATTAKTSPWHRGVIGILASRVVDRTGRPALVLTHEDGQAYGSGRSIKGFHLLEALTTVHAEKTEPLFTRFGGHAHAVGFSLPSELVPELRSRMESHTSSQTLPNALEAALEYDAGLRLSEITPDFLKALEMLGPFGNGNPEPIFVSRSVRLASAPGIIKQRHLRLNVEDLDGDARISGVAWSRRNNWAALAQNGGWAQGDLFDLAYRMRKNWHPDFGGWELEITAIEPASPARNRSQHPSLPTAPEAA